MEILNIYTSEEGGEKLYSVSLDNEELRLFSEYQKEFGKFDVQVAKKLYPNYDKYVGGNPKQLKSYLRDFRNSKIVNDIFGSDKTSQVRKNLDYKLLKEDLRKVNKKNKNRGRVIMS